MTDHPIPGVAGFPGVPGVPGFPGVSGVSGSRRRRGAVTPRILGILAAFVLALAPGWPAAAQDPGPGADAAERGRAIAEEADRRDRGFGDSRARMEMILVDRRGDEARRELEMMVLELPEGEERSIIHFESPRDIRGTALLTYSYPEREDEQWLYLPALRRTKRISASGRSSPFMGSEFAYEDLVRTDVAEFDHRFLREEDLDGVLCWVIERIPRYEGTGYSRQRVWIDQAEYRVQRVDYFDLRDRELKTLTVDGYERYLDGLWRASEATMVNHRTDETTVLLWRDYRFRTGLTERDFTRAALERLD